MREYKGDIPDSAGDIMMVVTTDEENLAYVIDFLSAHRRQNLLMS